MGLKKFIVSTSIYPPSKALALFDAMPEWQLIVAGDLKTPENFKLNNGIYLTPNQQAAIFPEFSASIGWNCIQRRNIAILVAYAAGADVIALVDDDNIPMSKWGQNLLIGKTVKMPVYSGNSPVFDILTTTNHPELWHRGFPLQLVPQRKYTCSEKPIAVDVQADLWNGDPDIDAVCRAMYPYPVTFNLESPVSTDLPTPFNSQNTFISRKAARSYMCIPGIGRMDDIWGAYYAQACGLKVAFAPASVTQERNNHSLQKDIMDEALGYAYTLKLIEAIRQKPDAIFSLPFLPESSKKALACYLHTIKSIDNGSISLPPALQQLIKQKTIVGV